MLQSYFKNQMSQLKNYNKGHKLIQVVNVLTVKDKGVRNVLTFYLCLL